jgi:hypothetical protein
MADLASGDAPFHQEEDLSARYLNGTLSPTEADAFEAHYFECDRCWNELQRAVELRAAFRSERDARPEQLRSIGSSPRVIPRLLAGWRPLALAAGIAFATFGIWRIVAEPKPYDDTLRAPDASLPVSAYTSGNTVVAAWGSVPGAEIYHVRLFAGDGSVLIEREIADTTFMVNADLLPAPGGNLLYWEIEALDPLRQVVARSGLRKVIPPRE